MSQHIMYLNPEPALRFGIDLDGVLADFNDGFLSRLNKFTGSAWEKHHVTDYDYHTLGLEREVVYSIFESMTADGAYAHLQPMPDYHLVNHLPGEVHFVTSRVPQTLDATKDWLSRHRVTNFKSLTFAKGKKSSVGSFHYFVEDCLSNVLDLAPVCGHIFLMDHPYNQSPYLPDNVTRVNGWREIMQCLETGITSKVLRV